jgi:hypothetical protein
MEEPGASACALSRVDLNLSTPGVRTLTVTNNFAANRSDERAKRHPHNSLAIVISAVIAYVSSYGQILQILFVPQAEPLVATGGFPSCRTSRHPADLV